MNAVGLVEQESGRALGFYCSTCGRPQLPMHCQNRLGEAHLIELHRKADACCTSSVCPKHDYQLHGWNLCPKCVNEGPAPAAAKPGEAAR